jgi:hypothetical protein
MAPTLTIVSTSSILAVCSPATPSDPHAASLSDSRPVFSLPALGVQHAPYQQIFFSFQIALGFDDTNKT